MADKRSMTPWGLLLAAAVIGLLVLAGGLHLGPPKPKSEPEADQGERGQRAAEAAPPPGRRAGQVALARSVPERILVPSIGVNAPVIEVGLDRDGSIAVPPHDNPFLTGWFRDGHSPGEAGTAVIVGHVDVDTGPAVFYNLGALQRGARVDITRIDGSTAVFTVDEVRIFDRKNFPDKRVYGDTGRPELRLITCGGTFSRKTHYSANVVVFAHLTGKPD